MNFFRFLILFFFLHNIASAQLITPAWIDSVPGHYGFGADLEIGPDGYLYSAGCVSLQASFNQRIAVLKNDKNGNRVWMFQSDTLISGGNIGRANALAIDIDGFIYVAGSRSFTTGGDEDMVVIKLDTSGNIVWENRYISLWNNHDQANDVAVDDSGNVYITGTRNNINNFLEIVTLKFNSSGQLQWIVFDFVNNTSASMGANEIKVDKLGNVYVAGSEGYFISPSAKSRALIISYDRDGNQRWRKTYNPVNNFSSDARSVEVDDQSNAYISGMASDNSAYIIKYDSAGNQQWQFNFPGAYADDLELSPNGVLYMSGCWWDTSSNNRCDMLLAKVDTAGNQIWALTNGGNRNNWDYGMNIALGKNDEVYLSGVYSDSLLNEGLTTFKYDSSGALNWAAGFPGNLCFNNNSTLGSTVDDSGNVYLSTFYCYSGMSDPSFCTFRYGDLSIGINDINSERNFTIYPNPTATAFHLLFYSERSDEATFAIYDLAGRRNLNEFITLQAGMNDILFNLDEFVNGTYLLKMSTGKMTYSKLFVILK